MKIKDVYKVGQTVRDNVFSGRIGTVTYVSSRSVRVKYKHSRASYTGINIEGFAKDLEVLSTEDATQPNRLEQSL
jgi:hypothetical protein